MCDCFSEAKHKHSFSDNSQRWTGLSALVVNYVTTSVTCCPDLSRSRQFPGVWHIKHSQGWLDGHSCNIQTLSMCTCDLIATVRELSTHFAQITDEMWPKSQIQLHLFSAVLRAVAKFPCSENIYLLGQRCPIF